MPLDVLHRLTIEGISTELRVHQFEGYEGVSQLFELEVTFAAQEALDFDSVVRKKATLTIDRDGVEPCERAGVVSRIEQGETLGKEWHEYRVTIVPSVWSLTHRANSRIFQESTVPAIVEAVLTGAGIVSGTDYQISLQGTYPIREYCVQYRESDWDFVSRLLEEEGIFYYFEQKDSSHKIVFNDKVAQYPAIDGDTTVPFRPGMGVLGAAAMDDTSIVRLSMSEEVKSGKITLRDWDFTKPSLSLEAGSVAAKDTELEVYDYPGEYTPKSDGDTLAMTRLQEQTAARSTGRGESGCARLLAGHAFTLSEHWRDSFNKKYLVTRVSYSGAESWGMSEGETERPARYRNQFHVIAADVLFRPPRVTRRPHIHGAQTAIVVGPSGQEIYTDKYARVKVQFHWDRLGKKDDKSSCWIRVAQPWASAAFGAMFIPRINDEVVVTFLEGDPDRPLVVGSVYHGTNVPPYSLPADKTKSTIKSHSSPQGAEDTFNELRFEDKKGSEEVFIQAQKDWTINVKNDKNQKVGHDETLEIDNDRTKTVKHDQTATVEHDDTSTVKHDQTATVQHDQTLTVQNDRSVTVQNDHTESVSGNQTVTITKAQSVTINDKQTISVAKTRSLTVSDDVTESFSKKLTTTVGDDVSHTLQAKRTVNVTGDDSETIGGKQTVTISGDSAESVTGKKTMTVQGNVTITSGSSTVTIKPTGEISIQGTQITIDSSGPLKIHGATIDVKSDGPATVKAPLVSVSADSMNTVKGQMIVLDGQMINIG